MLFVVTTPLFAEGHDVILELDHKLRAAVYYPPGYSQDDSSRRWPTMLFSHGFAGSALSQDILLEKIAALGLLVVAIEHNDPVAFERIPPQQGDNRWKIVNYMRNHPFDQETYAYRPREFSDFVVQITRRLPIDTHRIIFAGHSMGGYTIFNAIKSATPQPVAMLAYSVGELNYKRGHPYFSPNQLAELKMPLLLIYGEHEFEPEKGAYAEQIHRQYGGPSWVTMIKDGNHLMYNDPTRRWGQHQRLQQIEQVFERSRRFLNTVLMPSD
jgi:pimeloyl-ACP methyl ester carboxylesterase